MESGLVAFAQVVVEQKPLKYLAGLLVLDMGGDPREFRCTSPVQPSLLQQILWGQRLQRYIIGELILSALVNSLELTPTVIVVEHRDFLVGRQKVRFPLVLVRGEDSGGESPRPDTVTAKLVTNFDGGREFVLECASQFPDDLEIAREVLRDFVRACHPLEPFRRIEQAVEVIKGKLQQGAGG